MRTLLVLFTSVSALTLFAPMANAAEPDSAPTGLVQVTETTSFSYQPTLEQDTRAATLQIDVYKAYGDWTPDFYTIPRIGEVEANLYYDHSYKSPFGDLKVEAMSGFWRESDGYIIPVYGEVARDFALGKKVTLTPFVGYGNWIGLGRELNRGYLQSGLRVNVQATEKLSLAFESAFSHCVKESAQMTTEECHDGPYANLEIAYDVGHQITLVGQIKATYRNDTSFGVVVRKAF
jgi:hypothetical protein